MVEVPLQTKLYLPPLRPNLIPRPYLGQKLNAGLNSQLILVSAPAGYGKTTLVAAWLAGQETSCGWLSLDEGDNDPARFLAYIIAALQTAVPDIGAPALALMQSPQPPLSDVLVALVNDLTAQAGPLLLILDDYHMIVATAVHDLVTFLLNHAPPSLHFLILTRADPPLPLSRLRARAQLVELRQEELRFATSEVSAFLNERGRLNLTSPQVAALAARTEGWVAGLQMAALALQGQADSDAFIEQFRRGHHYIMDYLADEVLTQRPPATRDFLLQTSILDRLCAPLCHAVTGRDDSQTVLEELVRANLFLLPLDETRDWFRYHHLFAHLLQQRLQQTAPASLPDLHQRAAYWYRENDLAPVAVDHLLRAGDFAAAADLIAAIADPLIGRGEYATLTGWLDALLEALIADRPRLALISVWHLLATRQFEVLELHLQTVEHVIGQIADAAERDELYGRIAVYRANILSLQGRFRLAAELAEEGLSHLSPQNRFHRAVACLILGSATRFLDDLAIARPALEQAAAMGWDSGDIIGAVIASRNLAQLHVSQGRLQQAATLLQAALPRAGQTLPIGGILYVGLGSVHYHRNELDIALHHLQTGLALLEKMSYRIEVVVGHLTLARVWHAKGDPESAWTAVHAAANYTSRAGFNPDRVEIAQANLHLRQGNLPAVADWAERHDPDALAEKQPLRLAERLLLARFYLAQQQTAAAATLLHEEREAAVQSKRQGDLVAILSLLALVQTAQGVEAALTTLAEALRLGEPGNFIRPFVDGGRPMARLLQTAAAQGMALDYVTRLLAAFGSTSSLATEALVEPLSERELEVLRLVAAGLTNRDIAAQLIIAHGTAKRHLSNIYGKLGVGSRTQAVARARELRLL